MVCATTSLAVFFFYALDGRSNAQMVALGLLATDGGIALLIAARQIDPRMMRKMMLGMRQSMMKEMMGGDGGFDPPEMCKKMMGSLESEKDAATEGEKVHE